MKISIITLHRIYNYGSALQAYATQRVFEEAGCKVEIIDYITPERTLLKTFLKPGAEGQLPFPKMVMYRTAKIGSLFLKEKTFGAFVRKNLKLSKKYITPSDLEKDPPEADIYVTGSDQVWNSKYNGIDRGFFLDFIPEDKKRIAFVASFGKEELDESETSKVSEYLKRYRAISVREDSAVQILDRMGITNAVQLIDPTLQLEKKEWLRIASKRLVKEKYLILMLLYNEDNHATEYARKIADEKGLKLVKISWEMKKPDLVDKLYTHRSPADFLSLFNYAEFVVTNSFHGLAFSINLEKQFVVVPRNEFNSRIDSLLRLCGLTERLVRSEEDAIAQSNITITYENVEQVLGKERSRARAYIDNVLKMGDSE